MFEEKNIDECVNVYLPLCGEAKKRVTDFQAEFLKKTGRHIGKKRAILKLLTDKNESI